jgi:hypothetical protein
MNTCTACNLPLPDGAHFCPACGIKVEPYVPAPEKPANAPGSGTGLPILPLGVFSNLTPGVDLVLDEGPNTADDTLSPIDDHSRKADIGGNSVTLVSFPPARRSQVILALRQVLGYSPEYAAAYAAATPCLLASGLEAEMAETLRAALVNAGGQVTVEVPPEAEPAAGEPTPEPLRRMEREAHTVLRYNFKPGLRTITGLDIGHTHTYLAHARADMLALVAAPKMLKVYARTALPVAYQPARSSAIQGAKDSLPLVGEAALQSWTQEPGAVQIGQLTDDALVGYLGFLAQQLTAALGPTALAMAEGAATNLGIPAGWEEAEGEHLMEAAIRAGFPVVRVVPRPLAALACHLAKTPAQEKVLVVDWGGETLEISFVEHGGSLEKPHVFEHVEHLLGGERFETILFHQLASQLPPIPDESWERSLRLYTRRFLADMWAAFASGAGEYQATFTILPGMEPARVAMERESFETLASGEMARLEQVLAQAVEGVGLRPEHIDQVILAGGCANNPQARGALRNVMHREPLVSARPEETTALGLAIFRLSA